MEQAEHPFNRIVRDYSWIFLPITSVLLLAATIPPVNFWQAGFVALVPLYIFFRLHVKSRWIKLAWGGFFFGTLFSSILLSLTVLQFGWIKEASIFTTLVKALFIPTVLGIGILGAGGMLLSKLLISENTLSNIFSFASVWTLIEWIIMRFSGGLEYSLLAYPAKDTALISFAGIGGVPAIIFFMAIINGSIGSLLFSIASSWNTSSERKQFRMEMLIPIGLLLCVSASAVGAKNIFLITKGPAQSTPLSVAVIQNQTRGTSAFGNEIEGVFQFPELEAKVAEANTLSPNIIIYPFSPWVGALGKTEDNLAFDRKVVHVDHETFEKWAAKHVKPDIIFVTWNTVYRDGKFYNELNFWKNGHLIGMYQKQNLFPFMDYTPTLAQSIGLFTTPYDATPGTDASGLLAKDGIRIGGIICSEVSTPIRKKLIAKDINILFAIGSEAIFSNGVAGEINLANAQYRAIESGRPVIRANRFGPSAFIDRTGTILSAVPYGFDDILLGTIDVPDPLDSDDIPTYNQGAIFPIGSAGFLIAVIIGKWRRRGK